MPVRAAYDPASGDYGIGLNPFRSDGTAWYALADLVASVILTGRVPTVRRAVTFRPVRHQGGSVPSRFGAPSRSTRPSVTSSVG